MVVQIKYLEIQSKGLLNLIRFDFRKCQIESDNKKEESLN